MTKHKHTPCCCAECNEIGSTPGSTEEATAFSKEKLKRLTGRRRVRAQWPRARWRTARPDPPSASASDETARHEAAVMSGVQHRSRQRSGKAADDMSQQAKQAHGADSHGNNDNAQTSATATSSDSEAGNRPQNRTHRSRGVVIQIDQAHAVGGLRSVRAGLQRCAFGNAENMRSSNRFKAVELRLRERARDTRQMHSAGNEKRIANRKPTQRKQSQQCSQAEATREGVGLDEALQK